MTADHFRWWLRARDAYFADGLGEALACIERYREVEPGRGAGIELHCRILTDLHRLDDAAALVERMVGWTRAPLQVSFAIACCFDARHQVASAEEWYRRCAAMEPTSTVGAILLGGFQARRGQLTAAEATQRHATTLEGDVDEAFLNLGIVLRAQGRFEEAVEAVQQAVALDPTSETNAAVLADVQRATALSREGHDPWDATLADRWWRRAVSAWDDRGDRIGEALAAIERHRRLVPRSEAALLLGAEILTDLRRFDEAWELLQQVQASRSWRQPPVFAAVARHLELAGDLATAEEWHTRRAHDQPESPLAFLGLGSVYTKQGRLSDAEATYRRATTLDGARSEASFNLGLTLRSLGRFADAIDALAKALALDPAHPRAAGVLVDVERAERLDDAAL